MTRPPPGCAVCNPYGGEGTLNEELSASLNEQNAFAGLQIYTFDEAAAPNTLPKAPTPPTPPVPPRQGLTQAAASSSAAKEIKYDERTVWYAPRVAVPEHNYGVAVNAEHRMQSESSFPCEQYPNDDAVRSTPWQRIGQWPGMRAYGNSGADDGQGSAGGMGNLGAASGNSGSAENGTGSGDGGGVELPPGTAHYLARDRGALDYNVLLRKRLEVAAAADHSGWSLMDVKLPFGWVADRARAEERYVEQQVRAADPRKQSYYGQGSESNAIYSSAELQVGRSVVGARQMAEFFSNDRAVMYDRLCEEGRPGYG